ncbi:MAG: hypothetical protein ABJO01_03195 [Parasphingorhabdus sp.]|uniref:hypothetical protein n=1 Tax=Parasphingorhabdus sp. TaxID=2709688 RepID=UPI003299FEF2
MEKILLILLAFAQAQPTETSPSTGSVQSPMALTAIQKRDLNCVAVFAIVASEQQRGIDSALRYPLLIERGRTYAGQTGERVMAETGQSRDQIQNAILAAAAMQQEKVKQGEEPADVVAGAMDTCLPLLDAALPPKPKPSLNQCAGMMQLAFEQVYHRERLSKKAQDLKTLAFVLDNRAREKMRAEGKSGTESDIILTQTREDIRTMEQKTGTEPTFDIDHCFTLAAPKKKEQNFEH